MRPGEILALRWKSLEGSAFCDLRRGAGVQAKAEHPEERQEARGAISDGTLTLLNEWADRAEDPSAEGFVFPSERVTTPLSLDNLWRRSMQPKLVKLGLGWASFSGTAKDQRQSLEKSRSRSEGCLRPEGPWNRRQPGSVYELRPGAEASSTQETRSRRASTTATRTPVRVSASGLME